MSTLHEQFIPFTKKWDEENGWHDDEFDAENCVEVAEDFAIGFAEHSIAKSLGVSSFKLHEDELQIYKKEKGL